MDACCWSSVAWATSSAVASCSSSAPAGSPSGTHSSPRNSLPHLHLIPHLTPRSIATAFAPNDTAFIIFVALLGLGAAANTPAGIRLLTTHFAPGPRRNQAFGVLGAGQPIGFILGLVLGGILTQSRATWRAIFYFQAGLGVFFTVLGWLALGEEKPEKKYTKGLDWGGALLSSAGVALLTYSLAYVPLSFRSELE